MSNLNFQDLIKELGIVAWGYQEDPQSHSFHHFKKWLADEKHYPLSYLDGERGDKRENLLKIFPSFQSSMTFLFDYSQHKIWQLKAMNFRVAGYAQYSAGRDYHEVLKEKCDRLAKQLMPEATSGVDYLICIDIFPVLDRDLAYRSGLGWFGKNSMLINRSYGSYFLIASILWAHKWPAYSRELNIQTEKDHCGHCTRCVDACPTLAIDGDARTIKTDLCLATYTIEMKDEGMIPPPELHRPDRGEIFGCDICQDVCPWNKSYLNRAVPNALPEADSGPESLLHQLNFQNIDILRENLVNMNDQDFKQNFKGTNFVRTKRKGILKNLSRKKLT